MGVVSNSSDIPLQRCPSLVIRADTPKGTMSMSAITASLQSIDNRDVQAEAYFPHKSYPQKRSLTHALSWCLVLRKTRPISKRPRSIITLSQCLPSLKTPPLTTSSNWPIVDANGNRKVAQAVILGLGSMFNHSMQEQNVTWERDTERQIITYRALRDIPVGEELCKSAPKRLVFSFLTATGISYGSHLTFKDADAPAPPPPEEELAQLIQIQLD